MFKLWRRNKDKGGVKAKKSRKIALCACAAALLASVTGASLMLGLNSHNGGNLGDGLINTGIHGNTASSSALSVPSSGLNTKYDYEMSLKGTPAQMAKIWDEAATQTGKHTLLKLEEEEWKAPDDDGTYGTSFGLTCTPGGEGELYVPVNITITLDLNGNTIDRNRTDKAVCQDGMVIWINGGTLNIIDSSGDDSGKITGGYEQDGAGGIWQDAGALNLYGGQITGNYSHARKDNGSGAGVYIKTGTFNMYGGKITDNGYIGTPVTGSVGTSGGGVALITSGNVMPTFNMYGGEISGNTATEAGGVAVFGDTSTKKGPVFNMYGGKITGNTVDVAQDGCGGGVYPYAYGTFNMYGGEISGNTTANAGGGVAVTTHATFNMNGGKITNNTASRTTYPSSTNKSRTGGGGIYLDDYSEFVMDGGEITKNKAHDGAGINAYISSTVTINDGLIAENECFGLATSFGGGGIAMGITGAKCTLNLNGGKILNNGLNKSGEGVAVKSPSVVNIGGPVIMYGNCYDATDGSEANLWVSATNLITVTDKLIKNGQAAHIGVLGPTATNANVITNTTPDNLCGYDFQQFFFSEQPSRYFVEYNTTDKNGNITSYNLRFDTDSNIAHKPIMWSYQTA
ncbi:MAG: hypothetical protein K2G38_00880, partial [Clostridia bacterium]|nr:hypothetical protein [Clostridia bacterium]